MTSRGHFGTIVRCGISPLDLLTERGHHFVWSIDRNSGVFQRLSEIGRVPETLQRCYEEHRPPHHRSVEAELARAFAGLGLMTEYVGHRVKQQTASTSGIPIQLTEVEVGYGGNGAAGRDVISIDISEYADPLHTRHFRVPFSVYLKTQRNCECLGQHVLDAAPTIFEIRAFELAESEAIRVMRDPEQVAKLAARASVRIPDCSTETETLLSEYQSSPLAKFPQWFYEQEHHPPEDWPRTYDRLSLDDLPACTRQIIEQPNDLLLKPAGIQQVVRVLISFGWHPRHIAGLIRSKYERDHG